MSRKTPKHHQASNMLPTEKADTGKKTSFSQEPVSEQERFRLIQQRAYQLWEQAGRPDGADSSELFWIAAEREVIEPASAR